MSDDDHEHVPAVEQRALSIEESVETATQWGREHDATVTIHGGRWTKPQLGVHRKLDPETVMAVHAEGDDGRCVVDGVRWPCGPWVTARETV